MIIDNFMQGLRNAASPAPDDDFWYNPVSAGTPYNHHGVVTADTAMQLSAVMACVRVLSESLGSMPLGLMRRVGDTREQATDLKLHQVLHTRPNVRMTPFEFKEMQQGHLNLRGNAYSLILRDAFDIVGLVPLDPDRMEVFLLGAVEPDHPEGYKLAYLYEDRMGRKYRLIEDEVWHQRFMGDGVLGESVLTHCRKVVELALHSQDHGIAWWKNAAKPGGVIQLPEHEELSKKAHRRLRKMWREAHSGRDLYSVAILEGGAKWQQMGVSMEDSQWLDSRRFDVVEIARMFRTPPHMIASAIEHGHTYANVEQSDLDFMKYSMLPWVVRWEEGINLKLVPEDEPDVYAKFRTDAILRADSKTRASFYTAMFQLGALSTNEIRSLEDRNPVEGGDQRFRPTSLVPLEQDASGTQATIRQWIQDAAGRIASAEAREMQRRLEAGADRVAVADWAVTFFQGKHREYMTKTLQPIAENVGRTAELETVVVMATSAALHIVQTSEDLDTLAEAWRTDRSVLLAGYLCSQLIP